MRIFTATIVLLPVLTATPATAPNDEQRSPSASLAGVGVVGLAAPPEPAGVATGGRWRGGAPETWIWNALRRDPERLAADLGIGPADLVERMNRLDAVYDSAADRPGEIAKTKLHHLAEPHGWTPPDIGRAVARLEAGRKESDIQPLLDGLKGVLLQWRGE